MILLFDTCCSSKERQLTDQDSFTPGPGDYNHAQGFHGANRRHKSTVAFGTELGDWSHPRNQSSGSSLGPGQYEIHRDLGKPKGKFQLKKPVAGVVWQPMGRTPSIPDRSKAMGYSENQDGALVLVQPADQRRDGPGAYDVLKYTNNDTSNTSHFSRLTQPRDFAVSRKEETKSSEIPGPVFVVFYPHITLCAKLLIIFSLRGHMYPKRPSNPQTLYLVEWHHRAGKE